MVLYNIKSVKYTSQRTHKLWSKYILPKIVSMKRKIKRFLFGPSAIVQFKLFISTSLFIEVHEISHSKFTK